jgi:hypothetical protein
LAGKQPAGDGGTLRTKKWRRAIFVAVTLALIAVPTLLVARRIAELAGPYVNQPTGVIIRPTFLEEQTHYYAHDSVIGHVHRPNVRLEVPWEEHPAGRVVMQTNNLGFREDQDTDEGKSEDTFRVLVTGDSHIDGLVNNSESFPNKLEAKLNGQTGPQRFEVINGGTGYFGPQHYHRFMERYAYLDPDALVVVVYTGNDFLDAVRFESRQDSSIAAGRDLDAWERLVYFGRLAAARRISHGATSQELNQVYFFKRFPRMKEVSLAATKRAIAELQEKCRSCGTALYLVLLPTRRYVEADKEGWSFKVSRFALWLGVEDLRVTREMTDSMAIWLDRKGIDHIDLAEWANVDPGPPLFWEEDSHLNVAGHNLVAEEVYRSFQWPQ